MSYTRKERDDTILAIGKGTVTFTNVSLLQELESFNWIYIEKANGSPDKIELTYSGKDLFKRLQKEENNKSIID